VELYINKTWTKRYGNAYMAEAFAWSASGNHATIYTTGHTAEEADATLLGTLRELRILPTSFVSNDELTDGPLIQPDGGGT
jgi:hypothetical protein